MHAQDDLQLTPVFCTENVWIICFVNDLSLPILQSIFFVEISGNFGQLHGVWNFLYDAFIQTRLTFEATQNKLIAYKGA